MADFQAAGPYEARCFTQMKVEKFRYVWKIHNFLSAYKLSKTMKSPTFSTRNGEIKGHVLIDKKWIPHVNKEFMSLHLKLVSCGMPKIDAALTFSLLDRKDRESEAFKRSTNATLTEGCTIGFDDFIVSHFVLDGDKYGSRLPKNELTILLDIIYVNEPVHQLAHNQAIQLRIPESGLSTDFGSLLDDAKLSDVTFSVDGHEFKGHKLILAARSPVFAVMFENDMAESRLNRVVIEDIDKDVFAEFLKFIYTDKTEKLDKMADELLHVADKYGVDKLKFMCVNALYKGLSVENSADILILAELHGLKEIKDEVMKFMNVNSKDVVDTAGFKMLIMSHPHLVADVFRARAH